MTGMTGDLDQARLSAWLTDNVDGFRGPLTISRFKGGQSNPTYRLSTPGRDYVLRRKPAGPVLKGAHAIDREARVMKALGAAGFPVPEVHALCDDEAVIGSSFYVMDMVEGRIVWEPTFPGLDAPARAAHFDAMNATLAQLHSLSPEALGLADYGRPDAYLQRQITRWSRQYREDDLAGRDPHMDRLVEWLPEHIPAGEETAVVHGDFRCDNLVFHPREPRIIAVLDWELSTLGHPLSDFAYHLMMYRLPPHFIGGMAGAELMTPGIPSEADYVAAYCRRTGRSGVPDLNFLIVFNIFRLAAILHGIKGRVARGTAASDHARDMAARFEPLAELAWRQALSAEGRPSQ